LTKVLPPLLGYRILSLVLISSVLRFAVSSAVPSRLKEVKHVEHIESDKLFFSVIGIKPIPGVDRGTMKYY
jgi:hypothetical protein